MPKWRTFSEADMERPLLDRPPNYDHDFDGRPPVGWHDDDPLLERLCRYHPERIPDELRARFQGDYMRARAPLVAAALSLSAA